MLRIRVAPVGVVSTVASLQEGPGFNPGSTKRAFLCNVCMFSLCLLGFPLGTPVSFYSSKTCLRSTAP